MENSINNRFGQENIQNFVQGIVSPANICLTTSEAKTSVKSFTASKYFIKSVCRVSLLNILYHRLPFDDNEFVEKKFENIPFKMFKRKSKHPIIREYHGWIHGIVDAIEKGYLRKIFLFFKNDEKQEILEAYKITLMYNNKVNNVGNKKKMSVDQVKSVEEMLHFFTQLGSAKKLENATPYIELSYNDEVPEDYQPVNFEKSDDVLCRKYEDSHSYDFVRINTGYHKFKGVLHGNIVKHLEARVQDEGLIINPSSNVDDIIEVSSIQEAHDISILDSVLNLDQSEVEHPESQVASGTNCACQLPFDNIETFKCKTCEKEVHAPCNGYMLSWENDKNYTCVNCTSDPYQVFTENRTLISRVRLVIAMIYKKKSLNNEVLDFVNETDKKEILDRLVSLNLLHRNGASYDIMMSSLENILKYFFTDIQDSAVLA